MGGEAVWRPPLSWVSLTTAILTVFVHMYNLLQDEDFINLQTIPPN